MTPCGRFKLFSDICAKRGVKSYNIPDKNCRTYMKCNEKGLDDPYCCRPGQRYDSVSNKCVPARTQKCKMQSCPSGFFEGRPLNECLCVLQMPSPPAMTPVSDIGKIPHSLGRCKIAVNL